MCVAEFKPVRYILFVFFVLDYWGIAALSSLIPNKALETWDNEKLGVFDIPPFKQSCMLCHAFTAVCVPSLNIRCCLDENFKEKPLRLKVKGENTTSKLWPLSGYTPYYLNDIIGI